MVRWFVSCEVVVWLLRCVVVAVWGSFDVGELRCGDVAVRESRGVGESACMLVAVQVSYGVCKLRCIEIANFWKMWCVEVTQLQCR